MLQQVQSRLGYLESAGLGYLSLDRTMRTLSGGEMRRVALTTALGSSLVNMLYVLDEPSAGLHPADVEPLVKSLQKLRDRGNTVVVVEHEEATSRGRPRSRDRPGRCGGRIVFQERLATRPAREPDGRLPAGRRGVMENKRGGLQNMARSAWPALAAII